MSTTMKDIVPEFYFNLLDVEQLMQPESTHPSVPKDKFEAQRRVADILLAANFMNIDPLVQLCCATIASWVKCKTPNEIKEVFGITEDFTEEEIALVKRENKEYEERLLAHKTEEQSAAQASSEA